MEREQLEPAEARDSSPTATPAAGLPALSTGPAQVLALQRSHGNRAVTGMVLARQTMTADERRALRERDRRWQQIVRAHDWVPAISFTEGLSADELQSRLRGLDWEDARDYALWTRTLTPGTREATAGAAAATFLLNQQYNRAVARNQWRRAVQLLDGFSDTELPVRARQIAAKGTAAVAAAVAQAQRVYRDHNHRVTRAVAYAGVENLVGPTARPNDATGIALGAATNSLAVPGGTVTAHERVAGSGAAAAADWYAFSYAGTQAEHTGWIQFIAREIERVDGTFASLGYFIPPALTHVGQPGLVRYGTPASPNWVVDTFANVVPFYESPVTAPRPSWARPVGTRGGHDTVPDAPGAPGHTTMIDRPGNVDDDVNRAFAPVRSGRTTTPVASVEARCRFHVYLVRGPEILYENTMLVTDRYTSRPSAGGTPTRTNTAGTGRLTDTMAPAHFAALTRRFPRFSYFRH